MIQALPDFIAGPEAMLFNSLEYLLAFLPLTVLLYFALNRHTGNAGGKHWLVLASLFFYGWWSLHYLWLIGASILFNYSMAHWLTRRVNYPRILLALAIAANLALLGYYKYADFFIANVNLLTGNQHSLPGLALPLGISFFTFTQIAFLVDVYRGTAREYNLLHYCLFVTYFPHLIAGPILHHSEMMPQFSSPGAQRPDWQNIQNGICLIALGLLKKVALADSLATVVNEGFSNASSLLFHQAWMTSLSYSLQLYFDFSGYTDIAIGSALLCNIRLPANFRSPYQASNIQDFWRRWHITLSRWLRDYLYIPLGGNRHGALRCHAALLATFVLGGLWHGANWTFVLWGALHGTAAVLHKGWQAARLRMPLFPAWLLTFLFVNTAWVLFRADNMTDALHVLQGMAGLHGFAPADELYALLRDITEPYTFNPLLEAMPGRKLSMLIVGLLIVWICPDSLSLSRKQALTGGSIATVILTSLLTGSALFYTFFLSTGIKSFIYFYF